MVLVVHDSTIGDIREIEEFELDLAFGSDENALKLEARKGEAPEEGQFVFIDGTEYGGVIDQASYEAGREATSSILCKGRTWHGILAGKRLLPDSGNGYLSVSGKAGDVLASLIARMGLSGLFSAASDDTSVSYTFDRFVDGYSGLKAMAKANGRKVAMRRKGGKVEISLPPAVDYANKVDSDLLDFTLTSVHRCVNHLVCAGTGELENRAVVHFYADAAGNVSHTQSLFGVDEISALYDYSNADEEKLEEEGRKKLQEYQTQGSVEVEAHDDIDVDVGDVISARDNAHGRTVTATVAKKIVNVSRGVATYSYEVGSETTTRTSSSGNAESSNGGHAYYAGSGLKLESYTFSAEVDAAALKAVEGKAGAAAASASNASAAAGKAEAAAKAATGAAAANAKAIAGKQGKLTAGANVTIDGATISAKDTTYDEATTSKAGLMSALDKKKLDKKVDDTASGVSAALEKLPEWTAIPTDSTQLVRRDTGGTATYGRVTFLTVWNYIKRKADAVYAAMSHTHPASQVSGLASVATSGAYADLTGAPSSMKNPAALTVQANGETVATYDGSSAATANITPANIGAAPSSHTHQYLPLSGGTLKGNVTAPKFIGSLQGTADRATTASRVANAGAGTANVARHVWFSGSDDETARVYNDAFRYNPGGNMLSCNVSGNAATANSAASAAKLAKARTVSISGAVNGSATWDGSGDLEIVVAGDSVAAGFLAAHPVGFYVETSGADPNDYGGTWERAPSVGPYTWLRTK